MAGRQNQDRDLVAVQRHVGRAIHARAVVGDDHEQGIAIPVVHLRRIEEFSKRVVGVAHARLASALPGLNPGNAARTCERLVVRSEEHTSELPSLMRISYAVFCLKKKTIQSIPYYS